MGKVDTKTNDRFTNPNQFKNFALNNNAMAYNTKRVNEIEFVNKMYQPEKQEKRGLNYLA